VVTTARKPRRLSLSRSLSILLALAAIGAAGVVFEEKRQASKEARDVAKLKRKIDAEREKISELNAEWSMLDQPARLQKIVELHLSDDEKAMLAKSAASVQSIVDVVKKSA
jgi:hypothetical protein